MSSKNLTVGMPLAVPHQRPPYKYASHIYPVYSQDSYNVTAFKVLDSQLTRVYHLVNQQESYASALNPITSLLQQVFFYTRYTHNYPEHYNSNGLTSLESMLKQVYWYHSYSHNPPENYDSKGLTPIDSLLKQVYWYLAYTHNPPEQYSSTGLTPLNSQLTQVATP